MTEVLVTSGIPASGEGTGCLNETIQGPSPQNFDAVFCVYHRRYDGDFCRDLEPSLDRPVVKETELEGVYSIKAQITPTQKGDFLQRLRGGDRLGDSPGQKDVEFLHLSLHEEAIVCTPLLPRCTVRGEGNGTLQRSAGFVITQAR